MWYNRSGKSLSDSSILLVAPTGHEDLFSTVLRFRKHLFAFSFDIKKMYQQIIVNEKYVHLQRIL